MKHPDDRLSALVLAAIEKAIAEEVHAVVDDMVKRIVTEQITKHVITLSKHFDIMRQQDRIVFTVHTKEMS
jgi:hypothetical protein